MITVTKLSDKDIIINCDMIEQIEANPDTTITLNSGKKIMVKDSVEELMERIHAYRKSIHTK